jgi:hypothetical protein
MGFMDKAKKLAEQAQEKLDEAQKNFNKSDSPEAQPGQTVRYDEHGRPIQEEETPAAAAPPPAAEPADAPPAEGAAPPPAAEPADAPPAEGAAPPPAAADPPARDANASPDPFKPIQ